MHREISKSTGRTAIDVGANIGSYTMRLAKRYRRVFAFEPNPYSCHILRLNVKLNRFTNVLVQEMALSENDGIMPFFMQIEGGGASSLDPFHYGIAYDRRIQVNVMKVDDFGIQDADLMKIDAEGQELSVLKGATQTIEQCSPTIGVEVHCATSGSPLTCECETCSLLRSLSYNTKLLGEVDTTPTHWVWAQPNELRNAKLPTERQPFYDW